MNDSEKKFLVDLLNTPSPTGFEAPGQRKWVDHVRSFADAVESDAYGSAWATRAAAGGEDAPTVFLEAHADEIGFMVNHITDEGFIHISRIGGSDRAIARAKRVRILGDQGEVLGVIGNTAVHLREKRAEKVPEWQHLFVDIGATSKDEVAERGIRVGHPIVYSDGVAELSSRRLVGRALDNRLGGYILARVMARLAGIGPLAAKIHVVNAVQEEIGGHGATMTAYRLRPTVAVILDVTHATDSPGIDSSKHGDVKLGAGPTITHGSCNHPEVVRRLLEVAERESLPIQHEACSMFTGTDTDDVSITRSGVPSALVSVPMRYMHSTVETVDLEDVENCISLLTHFASSVGLEDTFKVKL